MGCYNCACFFVDADREVFCKSPWLGEVLFVCWGKTNSIRSYSRKGVSQEWVKTSLPAGFCSLGAVWLCMAVLHLCGVAASK